MSADPSSIHAAAERIEDKPPPPTEEELAAQALEEQLDRVREEQRQEDREASWPDSVYINRERRAVEREASRALLGSLGGTPEWTPPEELASDETPEGWLRGLL